MKIAVLGNDILRNELIQSTGEIDWIKVNDIHQLFNENDVNAYFILDESIALPNINLPSAPIIINSVVTTLQELNAPENIIRINGWSGFLQKETWELSGKLNEAAINILKTLGKKYILVADNPGFISARVIAMIINEAYFAKGEHVSNEASIDTAMKLGTNYPFGPFEWAAIIGIKNIYNLINKLSVQDKRYLVAPELAKMITA
jgi:3-hydroxybutyryl-CoA dehydrogenase